MKINIYYGGRGVLDDPTLYVLDKMAAVLTELNCETARYNIYENKYRISTLPETLNDADGIILATTVEWLGIGGFMTEFLDACWLYGDRDRIRNIYMQPVVMSTTTGGRPWADRWRPASAAMCRALPSLRRTGTTAKLSRRRRKASTGQFPRRPGTCPRRTRP